MVLLLNFSLLKEHNYWSTSLSVSMNRVECAQVSAQVRYHLLFSTLRHHKCPYAGVLRRVLWHFTRRLASCCVSLVYETYFSESSKHHGATRSQRGETMWISCNTNGCPYASLNLAQILKYEVSQRESTELSSNRHSRNRHRVRDR